MQVILPPWPPRDEAAHARGLEGLKGLTMDSTTFSEDDLCHLCLEIFLQVPPSCRAKVAPSCRIAVERCFFGLTEPAAVSGPGLFIFKVKLVTTVVAFSLGSGRPIFLQVKGYLAHKNTQPPRTLP